MACPSHRTEQPWGAAGGPACERVADALQAPSPGRRSRLPHPGEQQLEPLDLDALSDAELQEIVLSHNLTPRKCLGFLTPLQALLKELGKDVQIRFA